MKFLGISGSLRKNSFNTALLRTCQLVLPTVATMQIVDCSGIPLYNEDVYSLGFPEPVNQLREKIREADAVVIATPEYNYSVPGVLKNMIDWVSRPPDQPFDGKPIAILGGTPGAMGTSRSQYHLRQVFIYLNGWILNKPEVMVANATTKFDGEGNVNDEATVERLRSMLLSLQAWALQLTGGAGLSSRLP